MIGEKMPTIVHFDMPADDIERAKKFYSELFGWKIERMPGPMELVIILLIVLVVFGAAKLPEIGKALGKGIKEFKKATKAVTDTDEAEAEK